MISGKTHYLVKWKEYNTSENTWELKENLLNCARTLQQFERGSESIKKLKLIDFSKESRLEESESFPHSQFHCYHCSVWSNTANFDDCDSFCFKVLKRWRTFAFSLKRRSACFTHSFIATLSSDFSWRWAWFRNLMIHTQTTTTDALRTLCVTCHNNTERKSSWTVITSNERSEAEGCNDFARWRQLCCLWEGMTVKSYLSLYSHLYRH
jgi:hypothetical protein